MSRAQARETKLLELELKHKGELDSTKAGLSAAGLPAGPPPAELAAVKAEVEVNLGPCVLLWAASHPPPPRLSL